MKLNHMNQFTLYTGKFLALIKEGHWEYAQRTNATGAVIIAAVTEDQKLLLVEQYRIPVHARTIAVNKFDRLTAIYLGLVSVVLTGRGCCCQRT
jgi:hypothetical protein